MQTFQPATDFLVCPPPNIRPTIQYYSIRVMPLRDGFVAVDVEATLCDAAGDMNTMDLGRARAQNRKQMLKVIDQALAFQQFGRVQ